VPAAPTANFNADSHASNGDAPREHDRSSSEPAFAAAATARTMAAARVDVQPPAVAAPALAHAAPAPLVMNTIGASTTWVTPPADSALPPDTAAQLVQSIRMLSREGVGDAQIRLQPEHFGEVSIAIRVEDGQVSARLQAESPAVRDWLQSNQQWLRHNLAEQHLTLDRLEVSDVPSEPRQSDRRGTDERAPQDQRPPRRPRSNDTTQRFEVVA
jgi:flagellar hook-length control protein FliK